ncbi:hypothetical protein SNE35_25810 [Paucibacter sp. R3-3]|uniref:Uncharacterized protein n=1 Tax=Roseateles agri TaxID=3098619 RepID=A0ABU5DRS7_9BURK|nr:hypothetical protein [Paucibacter sp. R3-3]MDY0747944.1 hypothetical protein [Paucibacter sp. R3-3]
MGADANDLDGKGGSEQAPGNSERRDVAGGDASMGGAPAPADDEELPILDDWLTPDEIDSTGDLGNDEDDLDHDAARWDAVAASPGIAVLLAGIQSSLRGLAAFARESTRHSLDEPTSDAEWRRLGNAALGLMPIDEPGQAYRLDSASADSLNAAGENSGRGGFGSSLDAGLAWAERLLWWAAMDERRQRARQNHANSADVSANDPHNNQK